MLNYLVSHAPAMVLIFLILTNESTILSCELKKYINHNRPIKHLLLFLIIYAFRIKTMKKSSFSNDLLIAFIIYIWFVFTMRAPFHLTCLAIFLLFIVFFIDSYQKKEDKEEDQKLFLIKKKLIISAFLISFIGFVYFGNFTRILYFLIDFLHRRRRRRNHIYGYTNRFSGDQVTQNAFFRYVLPDDVEGSVQRIAK